MILTIFLISIIIWLLFLCRRFEKEIQKHLEEAQLLSDCCVNLTKCLTKFTRHPKQNLSPSDKIFISSDVVQGYYCSNCKFEGPLGTKCNCTYVEI